MSERIRGSYDDALYKSTYTLLTYFTVTHPTSLRLVCVEKEANQPDFNWLGSVFLVDFSDLSLSNCWLVAGSMQRNLYYFNAYWQKRTGVQVKLKECRRL